MAMNEHLPCVCYDAASRVTIKLGCGGRLGGLSFSLSKLITHPYTFHHLVNQCPNIETLAHAVLDTRGDSILATCSRAPSILFN